MKYDEERQRIRENLKNENKTTYRIDEDNVMAGILSCIVGILFVVCDAVFLDWAAAFIIIGVFLIAMGLFFIYIECSKKSDLNKAVEAEISEIEKKGAGTPKTESTWDNWPMGISGRRVLLSVCEE